MAGCPRGLGATARPKAQPVIGVAALALNRGIEQWLAGPRCAVFRLRGDRAGVTSWVVGAMEPEERRMDGSARGPHDDLVRGRKIDGVAIAARPGSSSRRYRVVAYRG